MKRICLYCGNQSHNKPFVSVYKYLIEHIPSLTHQLEEDAVVHNGTCRTKLYELVKADRLPCCMDDRIRGNIAKYFIHCSNPLHIFHIHRSSIFSRCDDEHGLDCCRRQSYILHSFMIYATEIKKKKSNYLFAPSYQTEDNKHPKIINDLLTYVTEHKYNDTNWYRIYISYIYYIH
jgi:hypothetical protein